MATFKIRRGLEASLPDLSVGEPGFCTDTGHLYIGATSGDVGINSFYVTPEAYGAVGDGATDDSAAINAAIQAVHASSRTQGIVQFSPKSYRVTSEIVCESGVSLYGDTRGTYIDAHHTGASVFNMVGVTGTVIRDLMIDGASTAVPKCGILIGRDGSGGGAQNRLINLYISGYFSLAPLYMVSAEDNSVENLIVDLLGGGAMDCVRVSHADDLGVTGLTEVSSWDNIFINPYLTNEVVDASATCITLTATTDFNGFTVVGGRFIIGTGIYVTVRVLGTTLGGITFINPCGERVGTIPGTGINFSASGAVTLKGVSIYGGYLDATTPIYVNPSITAQNCLFHTGTTGSYIYDSAGTKIEFDQSLLTTDNPQFGAVGLGTAALPTLSLVTIGSSDTGKASTRVYANGNHADGARAYYLKNRAGATLQTNDIVFDEYIYGHDGTEYQTVGHRYVDVSAVGVGGELSGRQVFRVADANTPTTVLTLGTTDADFATNVDVASGKTYKINGSSVVNQDVTTTAGPAFDHLHVTTGTAPTSSPADQFQLYSADIFPGGAAPHFRTEDGTIIKLDQTIDTSSIPLFNSLRLATAQGVTGLTTADGPTFNHLHLTAGEGFYMTNLDGSITRRVRLNDAGDGFIFEALSPISAAGSCAAVTTATINLSLPDMGALEYQP